MKDFLYYSACVFVGGYFAMLLLAIPLNSYESWKDMMDLKAQLKKRDEEIKVLDTRINDMKSVVPKEDTTYPMTFRITKKRKPAPKRKGKKSE